jgi:glycosyltransferase involved in cell wall biosynthesis
MHVVISLSPGGTERLVVELVRRTQDRCHSVVCCLDEPGTWAPALIRDGIPVISVDRQPGFQPQIGFRVAQIARAHAVDVLHCHQYSAFVYGRIARAFARFGLVFTEHGRLAHQQPSWKRRLVNPMLGRMGGALFAVSAELRAHMMAEGLPASRITVIHNGIDPGARPDSEATARARARLGLDSKRFVVGSAARLDRVKDLDTLIRAVGVLKRRQGSGFLVIFGDGPEREALQRRVVEQDLTNDVLFAGYREDVRSLLPAVDLYVNSSISEGISLTILEAMAAALPVVATSVGGNPEIVRDGETGVLVPPGDVDSLASALVKLARDNRTRTRYGDEGRRRVLEHFTIDRMVNDYVAQYERAAHRPS